MQRALRTIDFRRRSHFFKEMCDVVFVAQSDVKYAEKLRNHYEIRSKDPSFVRKKSGMSLEDPHTINVISSIFSQKKRLMGLA